MKKNFNKILVAFTLSALVFSCSDDVLDQKPVDGDVVTPGESPVTSEDKMEKSVNGMFAKLANSDAFGADLLVFGDLISSNVFVSETNDGYFRTTNAMSWNASGSDFAIWDRLYDAVAAANDVLNSTIAESSNVKQLKAQAHIGRGLSYFYLLNYYTANPTANKNPELGIPIYTGNYDPTATYGRLTIAESYDQVIKDLEAGIVTENETPKDKGYFSNTVAKFILSKVYLTRGATGDYQKAMDLANEVLTKSPSVYKLISKDDYVTYFTSESSGATENQPETIWEAKQSPANNPQVNEALSTFYAETGSHPSLLVRREVYNMFNDGDVRKSLMKTTGVPTNDDPNGVRLAKYPLLSDGTKFTQNIKVFRMTDALFVKWEAMIKSGQSAQALSEINAFATERGGTTYSGDVLTALLTEKNKEFFGEGQRFLDLKRNNLGIIKNTNCFGNCTTEANSRIMTLPIPQSSMNLNRKMVQNPGWED